MKTFFRVLMFGMIMSAVSAVSVFAQDACTEVEAKQTLYKQFTDNFADKSIEKRQVAIVAGKQYVSKYGACPDDKAIVDYLNTNVPAMEKVIETQQRGAAKDALYNRFNTSVAASKTADILSSGKEILSAEPDFLDVTLTLASAGFDQAVANPPVDTFNNDTIIYSKMAIEQLEANKASKTGDYGVKQYGYKTKEFAGKENALGLMNYDIGYIMYYRQGKDNPAKKKEALPYLYKSTQYNAFSKTDPFVYQTIGAWYLDEAIRLDADRLAKIKAAGGKDTDETLAIYGMEKGYADRSIDAYARAYKIATDAKRKDALMGKLKELYGFRYDNKIEGIDAFVATVMNTPMPDPTTEPTPVKEAPSTTTTTSGAGVASTMKSDTTSENSGGMAKPTGSKTGGVTTGAKSASNGTTTTPKPKTVVKPAPKKKGTR